MRHYKTEGQYFKSNGNKYMGFSKFKQALSLWQYLKLYLWVFSLISLMLAGISSLIGRHPCFALAAPGTGAIPLMLMLAFSGGLLSGVLLQLIDR
jgi:hypothetical protein